MRKYQIIILSFLVVFIFSCVHSSDKTLRSVAQMSSEATMPAMDEDNFNLYFTQWETIKDVPIYNQSGFPACYSFAASQLTEYYVRKTGQLSNPDSHVSPLWGAFLFKDKSGSIISPMKWVKKTMGYGFSRMTTRQLEKFGICDSKLIDSNLKAIIPGTHLGMGDIVALVDAVFPHRKEASAEKVYELVKNERHLKEVVKSIIYPVFNDVYLRKDDALDLTVLKEPISYVLDFIQKNTANKENQNYFKFYENVILKGCEKSENITNYDLSKIGVGGRKFESNEKVIDKIVKGFKDTNYEYPVVIGYCSNVYKTDPKKIVEPRNHLLPRIIDRSLDSPLQCPAHYSLVMGRRFNPTTQTHDFLVRNSYGNFYMFKSEGCFCKNESLNRFENCGRENNGTIIPPKHLTVLGCWINQENLAESIFDINYYKANALTQ